MKNKTGWLALTSYQQVFKLSFKIPYLGKFQFIIKKQKMSRVGNSLYDNMTYGVNKDKIGDISGVRFITSSNVKENEIKIK